MTATTLLQGDCLKVMATLEPASVDMVLCDLPYGTTKNKWDTPIDLVKLWAEYKRVCKPSAAVVLTAVQPFTSVLVCSNLADFKYQWVWKKEQGTGHLNAKKRPMQIHEDVVVFRGKLYNPQMTDGEAYTRTTKNKQLSACYGSYKDINKASDGGRYPVTVINFNRERGLHPTQKPVPLMEYMVNTYTVPGELVLDNCMGSGTTGVACTNLGRSFIGIENDPEYFATAKKRIAEAQEKIESATS